MGRRTITSNNELDDNSNVEHEDNCISRPRHSETNGYGDGYHSVKSEEKAPFPFQFKYTPNKLQRIRVRLGWAVLLVLQIHWLKLAVSLIMFCSSG